MTKEATSRSGTLTETFCYTIEDGDGDKSTTTLTITLNNVNVAASDNEVLVNEAGLATGSAPLTDSEYDLVGAINPSGGTAPYTYALNVSGDGTYGTLTLNTNGTYTYTLDTTYDGPTANNGTNTILGAESFGYTVTDANGNTTTGAIRVDIIDDVPTAVADTNSVGEGAVVTGNVLTDGTDDVFGADGKESATGGVVGVKAGADTTTAASGSLRRAAPWERASPSSSSTTSSSASPLSSRPVSPGGGGGPLSSTLTASPTATWAPELIAGISTFGKLPESRGGEPALVSSAATCEGSSLPVAIASRQASMRPGKRSCMKPERAIVETLRRCSRTKASRSAWISRAVW